MAKVKNKDNTILVIPGEKEKDTLVLKPREEIEIAVVSEFIKQAQDKGHVQIIYNDNPGKKKGGK